MRQFATSSAINSHMKSAFSQNQQRGFISEFMTFTDSLNPAQSPAQMLQQRQNGNNFSALKPTTRNISYTIAHEKPIPKGEKLTTQKVGDSEYVTPIQMNDKFDFFADPKNEQTILTNGIKDRGYFEREALKIKVNEAIDKLPDHFFATAAHTHEGNSKYIENLGVHELKPREDSQTFKQEENGGQLKAIAYRED